MADEATRLPWACGRRPGTCAWRSGRHRCRPHSSKRPPRRTGSGIPPAAQTFFPAETRYFRKAFSVKEDSRLALDVTADNAFTLYLDGKLVAEGNDWSTSQHVEARLAIGPHVLAAKATNEAPGPAGFLLRGGVLPLGQGVPGPHRLDLEDDRRAFPRATAGPGSASTIQGWSRALDLGPLGPARGDGLAFGRGRRRALPRARGLQGRDRRRAGGHGLGRRLHVRPARPSLRLDRAGADRPPDRRGPGRPVRAPRSRSRPR